MKVCFWSVHLFLAACGCTTAFEALWLKEQVEPDRSVENAQECRTISMVLWHECQDRTRRVNENGVEEVSDECQLYFPPIFDGLCCSTKKGGCAPLF